MSNFYYSNRVIKKEPPEDLYGSSLMPIPILDDDDPLALNWDFPFQDNQVQEYESRNSGLEGGSYFSNWRCDTPSPPVNNQPRPSRATNSFRFLVPDPNLVPVSENLKDYAPCDSKSPMTQDPYVVPYLGNTMNYSPGFDHLEHYVHSNYSIETVKPYHVTSPKFI
ncbi:hypothetical protein L1987_06432 [Smallanthus sonchifolius]|uniref:Uncharacterized protein n=1 Tax=Smallanthus sonchifolius TaxID=185202 RepID=A0ACB9JYH5_9ASTR|nr:hypothetical protein L1987_06432 [Smallanthus sonchifolius]